ncbi:MAG: 2-C-methyl-D-erythritol 4-phosphate cytidylyltransferase [Gammaproteobacteria bacterium]|nr:2-C-methyl-D-erythritol 4-phosphate cytidylyltransferase [Gammaproteobacteria bacterium]MCW8840005.1 2-C-methyl-D-erythritol 4-phosphate cytidylyltransferase [Gammaproteobacteria bacterium]MCW8928576.1 2-C-methyl-D-erythritol 4-phosphate cytidylyltransferase [Gammaproteobacteria bacterium]MCW8958779.1 2-C-methyl-D-erythritol 4-phosphate cytidylyltransferase [Gammaproteobacteria bacterium]MCW8972221.1 2-C-methyl-D-erythritol 4-phosphate cytidylyltransferase [Gammaproteobacteria bacterium]
MTGNLKFWAVIPAAGVGKRMQADRPKQYLELHGRTVLEHTLMRFLDHPQITGVVVALTDGDPYWQRLALSHPKLMSAPGGEERCHSVLNALQVLQQRATESDWVLVHDAARPCLRREDVDRLIAALTDHPVGGLLGLPVADTMKRTDAEDTVLETVPRDNLWRALTPQMFRLGELAQALESALKKGQLVTDEASAMELAGKAPKMVEGHGDNIKITRPQDLRLAELYLAEQD